MLFSCIYLGKKVAKGKDKAKDEKLKPTDHVLRDAICEILKEVDFNTVRSALNIQPTTAASVSRLCNGIFGLVLVPKSFVVVN